MPTELSHLVSPGVSTSAALCLSLLFLRSTTSSSSIRARVVNAPVPSAPSAPFASPAADHLRNLK
eukprot:5685635-Pyramimonas_sp.AAC.1